MQCSECELDGLEVRVLQETWADPVSMATDGIILVDVAQTESTFTLICPHCGFQMKLEGVEEV